MFIFANSLREWSVNFTVAGVSVTFGVFDFIGLAILLVLVLIYLNNFKHDAKEYAELDPVKPF